MIQLAMEMPTVLLGRDEILVDLEFALAHQVLADPAYRQHFASRPKDVECILDNSVHELGAPLDYSRLREAAELIKADFVIVPDALERADWSFNQIGAAQKYLEGFRLAVVLLGRTLYERRRILSAALEAADMLCLPYREPRLEWFLSDLAKIPPTLRIHLLGVSSLTELAAWKEVDTLCRSRQFSVDTSKPVKAGLLARDIEVGDLRHMPIQSARLLNLKEVTPTQLERIKKNTDALRMLLQ